MHDEILANIHKRNVASLNVASDGIICDEFGVTSQSQGQSTTRESLVADGDEMPVIKADMNLTSVINPITGRSRSRQVK
mgnify:CR=1 FL=1